MFRRHNVHHDPGISSYPINPGSGPVLGPSSHPFNPGSNPSFHPGANLSFLPKPYLFPLHFYYSIRKMNLWNFYCSLFRN